MTDTLGKAFLATQQAVKNPPLDTPNPHYNSRFASLKAHLEAIKHVANENGLLLVQEPVVLDDGAPGLRTRVIHADTFEFMESTMALVLAKNDPQAQGSAITYARRYALAAIFGLVGEDDDDGHAASSVSTGSPQRRGGAQAAPAAAAETPSPSAAAPAAQALVAKAQQAQQANKAARPDIPVQIGTNTKGAPKFECVTFVNDVTFTSNGWTLVRVVLDGQPRELSTKLPDLSSAAAALKGTSVRVRWTETETEKGDKTYVNRYLDHIEVAEGVADTFAGVPELDEIPFGPVVW